MSGLGLLEYGLDPYGGSGLFVDPLSLHTRLGAPSWPLDPDDFDDALAPLDPARDQMLDLFETVINAQLGSVWAKVTATLPTGHVLRDTTPVMDRIPFEPDPAVMCERKAGWPVLILHRTGTGVYDQKTLFVDSLVQPWALHYVLGPVTTADIRKLGDVLVAAAKLIRITIRDQGHAAFEGGTVQFGTDRGTLARVDLKSHDGPGAARFAGQTDGPLYLALSMALETEETLVEDLDAYEDIEEFAFTATLEDQDGASEVVVEGDSDAPTPTHS